MDAHLVSVELWPIFTGSIFQWSSCPSLHYFGVWNSFAKPNSRGQEVPLVWPRPLGLGRRGTEVNRFLWRPEIEKRIYPGRFIRPQIANILAIRLSFSSCYTNNKWLILCILTIQVVMRIVHECPKRNEFIALCHDEKAFYRQNQVNEIHFFRWCCFVLPEG